MCVCLSVKLDFSVFCSLLHASICAVYVPDMLPGLVPTAVLALQ